MKRTYRIDVYKRQVKYRVETMVGIKVDKVNVTVEGIRVN